MSCLRPPLPIPAKRTAPLDLRLLVARSYGWSSLLHLRRLFSHSIRLFRDLIIDLPSTSKTIYFDVIWPYRPPITIWRREPLSKEEEERGRDLAVSTSY